MVRSSRRSQRSKQRRPPLRELPTDGAIGRVPIDGRAEPVLEPSSRAPAKSFARTARVQHTSRLAVGLRAIPSNESPIADELGGRPRKISDRDLLTRAEVHGILPVVA